MADKYVQVAPDSTGKKIATVELVNGTGDTVELQLVPIADPTTYGAIARVAGAAPGASDYGLVVREAPANVDTGIVQGTGSLATLNGAAIGDSQQVYLDGLAIEVHASVTVSVTITNGAGQALVPTMTFYGPQFLIQPLYGRPVTGLKLNAPSTVTVQAWGRK